MQVRRGVGKVLALTVVVSMPLLGMSGIASAKNAVGSPKWCAAHPKQALHVPACRTTTGGGTGGTGGTPPTITVQIDPNPLVETGHSDIDGVVQVETSPSFAGDPVTISSSQLQSSCADGAQFETLQSQPPNSSGRTATVTLDDDGNATVLVAGQLCAPGSDVIEADLGVAPYYTALGTLVASPPVVTASGVFGFPTTSGTVTTGEVETGDTTNSGNSDVYAVFYVETDPVYAEQQVEISSPELQARCGDLWAFSSVNRPADPTLGKGSTITSLNTTATATLDDDGNAVFLFVGESCAAGPSTVIADVMSGSHPTYTTTFNINAPAPTI